MEFKKAHWATNGDSLTISMPLTKVDQENRLVSGWASLDNCDSQGDVILAEANSRAFSRFRGNIREMHQPLAVGKMVNFKEDSYYDPETQKFYNGIYVTVYVSKGAPDTWEKVLDGTLAGFSIGGSILDAETQWVKDANSSVRFVKDYELVELSLVDSPANQLANIFSITKAADGTTMMKGMAVETKMENIFWCAVDEIAKTSTEETAQCANCGSSMQNIGWYEYDGGDRTEKVKSAVAAYHSSNTNSAEAEIAKQEVPANNEGGVNVAEENVTPETTNEETAAPVEEATPETQDEETVAPEATEGEAANVSEVGEEPDFAKMFGDLQSAIQSDLEKTRTETHDVVTKATEAFETKISELAAKHDELTTKFAALEEKTADVEKALQAVESATAVKKSGDLGGSTEDNLEKSRGSKWGGRFLSIPELH